jgi:3-oxoacyl-[acyl-carrier protein] reductase
LARNVGGLPFPSMPCDVAPYGDVKAVAQFLRKNGSPTQGLINAAGIAWMNLAVTTPPSVSQNIVHTNLLGTIYCCELMVNAEAKEWINY